MYDGNHLAQAISSASEGRGGDLFIEHGLSGETVSYGAFWQAAERMAAVLVAAGVEPGDRVAVQAAKSVAMLELYVGCVLAGGVLLPLNPAYTASEVGYFLTDAAPRVFVLAPGREGELAPVAAAVGVARLFTLDAAGGGTLADARDGVDAGFQPGARGPEDLAAILYTSGTTGRSKGAMLTHRALASNSATLCDIWRFSRGDVLIHALPVFHTHGLFVATNVAMMAGASCLFLPGFDADAILRLMPRATALMGVPTFYTRLLEAPGLGEAAAGMRLFISGSAPLLAETHARWRAVTGHAILERYGMTETNMNTSNPYHGDRRPGTVGQPLPGVELRITGGDSGAEVAKGEIGVIEVRGPNVFAGYWNMPEKTREELRPDGWFITGDLGVIDEDGYVTIVGRAKDLVISGGFNVYPKEVEAVIDALDGVVESAVIGAPHPDLGEGVVAVVAEEPGAGLTEDGIKAAIAPNLARFKQPGKVIVTDSLPRNTMGKVQKAALRTAYRGVYA